MEIYLINPTSNVVNIIKKNAWNRFRIWKPLGLMVLAGLTPDTHDVTIFDENCEQPDYGLMPVPDIVGITAFTSQVNRAYEIADMYRKCGVTVVMGGIHASTRPDEALEHVDSVVVGEAESVWMKLLQDFTEGKLKTRYIGEHVDMVKVPTARHELLSTGYAFGSIQTTRGCPLACSFCSVSTFNGRRYRQRPIEHVIKEFGVIKEKLVLIVDDNLIGTSKVHVERAKELFRAMIKSDVRKKWIGQVTINIADDEELLDLAKKSGCVGLFIGFEALTTEGLTELGKKFNSRKNRNFPEAVQRIKKHGILVAGSFIMGLDADTAGIGKRIAVTAETYGVDILNTLFLTPLPGTTLWDSMFEGDRIIANDYPRDWQYYSLTFPVSRFQSFTWDEIIEEMDICDKTFYSWPRIFSRVINNFLFWRKPVIVMVTNMSFRNTLQQSRTTYKQFISAKSGEDSYSAMPLAHVDSS